jgi:hypothetical protein
MHEFFVQCEGRWAVHAAEGGVVRRDEAAPVGSGDLLVAFLASQAVAVPDLSLHYTADHLAVRT